MLLDSTEYSYLRINTVADLKKLIGFSELVVNKEVLCQQHTG